MGSPKARFGYADDVGLLVISPSLDTNSRSLSDLSQEALNWGSTEGITFDPAKSELMHFSRRRADKNPTTTPSVAAGPIQVSEGSTRLYLRWLGVLKLTFKWHAKEMASKALIVANARRSLGNTVTGVPPHLLQQAVKACVLRKAYYGAETWWPGHTRPGPISPISNRVDGLLDSLAKEVLAGARAILPVYCTTPTAVLHRESGLLPPEIELNHLAVRYSEGSSPWARTRRSLARALPTARFSSDLWLCLDNLEVATRLLSLLTGSSQAVFSSFCFLATAWPLRERLPHTHPGALRVRWVPGHIDVPGNVAVDAAAKEGASLQPPPHTEYSYASLKRRAKASANSAASTLWLAVCPQTYRDLGIPTAPRLPDELRLPCPLLGRILAARSGHGDFADYHERFKHDNAHLLCRCGAPKPLSNSYSAG